MVLSEIYVNRTIICLSGERVDEESREDGDGRVLESLILVGSQVPGAMGRSLPVFAH